MQNLDVQRAEVAWSSLSGDVFVPHTDAEYDRIASLLDQLVDEVGEDENHPLASLMEVLSVLIEKYEAEHVPELIASYSDYYTNAEEAVNRFLGRISAEADDINAKINGYADRMGRITQQGNPAEFDAIIKGMAADLELFAERIDDLLPDYRRNLELLTEGFVERNKSLDPTTDAGAQELEGKRRRAQGLAETAREVKAKITALRGQSVILRDANHDHRLTQSAHRLIDMADALSTAYEDLETFALKVCFSANK